MIEDLAPIALFVYNRPKHTEQTITALKKNVLADESELYIYSDAPKKECDREKVQAVREYIKTIEGFKKVTIIERTENYGLAKSIIDGVSDITARYGKIIVLEDDLITEKFFLKYMNDALERYKDNSQVYSITGYSYMGKEIDSLDTYFLKLGSSWSWGTWKDRWEKMDTACTGWEKLKEDRKLRKQFDYDYSYPFFDLLLRQMKEEKTNSWAIKWYWTIFKNEGLTLYPSVPLVYNAGFDGSGEHCGIEKKKQINVYKQSYRDHLEYSVIPKEDPQIRKKISKVIRRNTALGEKWQLLKDIWR